MPYASSGAFRGSPTFVARRVRSGLTWVLAVLSLGRAVDGLEPLAARIDPAYTPGVEQVFRVAVNRPAGTELTVTASPGLRLLDRTRSAADAVSVALCATAPREN